MIGTLVGRGSESRYRTACEGVYISLGFSVLGDIQADFVRKSRGQTGEDGVTWQPLSPKTLAYSRRFGPGEKTQLKRAAGLGQQHAYAPGGKDGLLTKAQLKRWRTVYARLLSRFAVDLPIQVAKGKAAAIAWTQIKAEGGQTKLDVFGHRKVDILRDTGILLNSLSIGNSYEKRTPDQIFELLLNGVVVGTNVPYARAHNEGVPGRLPARPFIPKEDKIPAVWLSRLLNTGMRALSNAIASVLQGAA